MNQHGRRPRFSSPLTDARKQLARVAARPFKWFRPSTRFLIGFFVLAVLSTLLLARTRSTTPAAEAYQEGDVVRADVVAPADITAEDAQETEHRREAAQSNTPPVWDFDPMQTESAVQNFRASWEALKRQAEARAPNADNTNGNGNTPPERSELVWPGVGADRQAIARAVVAHRFDPGALETLSRLLREHGGGHVYDERDATQVRPEGQTVEVRGGAQSGANVSQSGFVLLSNARENLRRRILQLSGWRQSELESLASALLPLLKPTVSFNREATEAARRAATKSVPPAIVVLKRNQTVAREGDTVTPQMLRQFAAVRGYSHTERRPQHYIGIFIFVCAVYWAAWRFTEYRNTTTTLPLSPARGFTLVAISVLTELALMRVGFAVAEGIAAQSTRAPTNDAGLWSFAIPFAAAALLVTLLVDTQLALITAVLTAVFAGLLAPNGMLMTCFALVSSSAAIYGIGRYRERQSVTKAARRRARQRRACHRRDARGAETPDPQRNTFGRRVWSRGRAPDGRLYGGPVAD